MCGRSIAIILSLVLLAPLSAVSQPSESPKQVILDKLLDYQIRLEQVKFSIAYSEQRILDLSTQISDLERMLSDSKTESQKIIDDIQKKLDESKKQLLILEVALQDQQTLYKALLMGLERLEKSSKFFRNTTILFGATTLGFIIKEIGHAKEWW